MMKNKKCPECKTGDLIIDEEFEGFITLYSCINCHSLIGDFVGNLTKEQLFEKMWEKFSTLNEDKKNMIMKLIKLSLEQDGK